jgi:AcrR family transcriptional regulator
MEGRLRRVDAAEGAPREPKRRVIKAPAVRRAELLDCAQRLFMQKGYERTTINDVIAATGLSKGAFYHHFRAKEDLLEAITLRFGQQALSHVATVQGDGSLNALQRLNQLLAMSREWKIEHLPQLRPMFAALLRPDNAVLYHRIVGAIFAVMAPTLTDIIEQGAGESVFHVIHARTTAEAILGMHEGRRGVVMAAMDLAERGDVDRAVELIMQRVRAEEAIIERLLGLPGGSIDLAGSPDVIREMMNLWNAPLAAEGPLGAA